MSCSCSHRCGCIWMQMVRYLRSLRAHALLTNMSFMLIIAHRMFIEY